MLQNNNKRDSGQPLDGDQASETGENKDFRDSPAQYGSTRRSGEPGQQKATPEEWRRREETPGPGRGQAARHRLVKELNPGGFGPPEPRPITP